MFDFLVIKPAHTQAAPTASASLATATHNLARAQQHHQRRPLSCAMTHPRIMTLDGTNSTAEAFIGPILFKKP